MIKEYTKNIKKCHNCGTFWAFETNDVKEKTIYDGFYGDYKETYIICPKCNNYLELYNKNGVYR